MIKLLVSVSKDLEVLLALDPVLFDPAESGCSVSQQLREFLLVDFLLAHVRILFLARLCGYLRALGFWMRSRIWLTS